MSSRARVLVVDDEPDVLGVVNAILASAGLHIVTAPSAEHALGILQQQEDFALVLSDVRMGSGLSGPQFVGKVKQLCPSTAVALMSGEAGHERIDPQIAFIQKPFRARALIATIEQLLARHRELSPGIALTSRRPRDWSPNSRQKFIWQRKSTGK